MLYFTKFLLIVGVSLYNSNFRIYEENVVTSFKSNLLLMIFWFHIINYNS
jgi:hypothetical protein